MCHNWGLIIKVVIDLKEGGGHPNYDLHFEVCSGSKGNDQGYKVQKGMTLFLVT